MRISVILVLVVAHMTVDGAAMSMGSITTSMSQLWDSIDLRLTSRADSQENAHSMIPLRPISSDIKIAVFGRVSNAPVRPVESMNRIAAFPDISDGGPFEQLSHDAEAGSDVTELLGENDRSLEPERARLDSPILRTLRKRSFFVSS